MPQNSIGIRWGYSDGTSIKVVAHSLSSSNVTITVNGADTVLSSMTGLGADSGTAKTEAFFYDSATISGLTAFTEYSYTATQDSNSITGTFTTAPDSVNQDFAIFAITCDAIVTNNNNVTYSGMYSVIRDYMNGVDALPVAGMLHIDDHYGYMPVNDVDDSAGTGHQITSGNTAAYQSAKTYDYALAVGAAHGLYSTSGNNWCLAGHDEDRTWCMRNIPMWPQKGDWDAGFNEMGWSISKTDTTTVTNPTYKDMYDNSLLVWDAVLKPLQPPAIDGANSNAWGFDMGCVHFTAMDAITTGSGDATGFDDAPTTIYGATQIASILSDMNNPSRFNFLALANGIRFMSATPVNYKSGSQNPISLHPTEYPALFTDAGGLMSLNSCNGKSGVMATLHGDYHSLKRQKNENTSGTNDEWFYSFNLGTVTGSTNMDNSQGSSTYDGSTVEYQEGTFGGNEFWCYRVEVYGSRYPKEVHIVPMDANGDIAGQTRKLVLPRGGNDAHEVTDDLSLKSALSVEV